MLSENRIENAAWSLLPHCHPSAGKTSHRGCRIYMAGNGRHSYRSRRQAGSFNGRKIRDGVKGFSPSRTTTGARRLSPGSLVVQAGIGRLLGAPAFRRRSEGQRLPLANRMPPAEARRSPCAPHLAHGSAEIPLVHPISPAYPQRSSLHSASCPHKSLISVPCCEVVHRLKTLTR